MAILFLLILLVGTPAAAAPLITITSSNPWVIANNADSAVITISVTDGGKAIEGAIITMSVPSPWALRDTVGTTPAGGQFSTALLPTKKAGTVLITAIVTVPGYANPVTYTYSQEIIADRPYKADPLYASSASVGSITDITIRVTDRYGNPVTSRRYPTLVSFNTSTSTQDDQGFQDPSSPLVQVGNLALALNDSGYAKVRYKMKKHPADNFVLIRPPNPIPAALIKIQGIADLPPDSILQTVNPGGRPPTLPVSQDSKFVISYFLYDKYKNPTANQYLDISTNAGERRSILSNKDGTVTISYGPMNAAGRYTITATSRANPSVSAVQLVQFLNGDPTNMLLTASPQSMASIEVNPGIVSKVMAKVVDKDGNPVGGETVFFSIQPPVNNGSYIQTTPPYLDKKSYKIGDEITAVTDENGLATVDFFPGGFVGNTDPRFSTMAVGSATVRARWSFVTRSMVLSYKNFPYLSVYTSVNPSIVDTNRPVEVNITVKGDGYALQPKPVDVYMVLDRSGSMLSDYPDRMVVLMNAAQTFATKFNYANDQLGQFSFGGTGSVDASWDDNCGRDGDSSDNVAYAAANYRGNPRSYSDYATKDIGLSKNPSAIANTIKATVPTGYTPMRYALKQSINALIADTNKGVVKALVLFSDGDYNDFGDPLARGSPGSTDPTAYGDVDPDYVSFSGVSSQNMAIYAKDNNIKIFTIGYGSQLSSGGRDTLQKIASVTGGKYYYASTGADLATVFTDIAGALKDTAGVDTSVALDFTTVDVTGVPVSPGNSFLKYEPLTRLTFTKDGSFTLKDNSGDWTGSKLNVSLGTIKVNEEWVITFTLNVTKSGNIKLLTGNSRVNFLDVNNIPGSVPLPDTYLTAIPAGTGVNTKTFRIYDLKRANSDTDRDTLVLTWKVFYDGDREYDDEITITRANVIDWPLPQYRVHALPPPGKDPGTITVSISDLVPGTYKVKVGGQPSDASYSFNTTEFTIYPPSQSPQIVIH